MDAEERPSKQQKLSHDSSEVAEVPKIVHKSSEQEQECDGNGPAASLAKEPQPPSPDESHAKPPREQPPPGMSRSQWKKQKRKAEWEAGREERKVLRKEKTKERKARKREAVKDAKEAGLQGDEIRQKKSRPQKQERVPIAFVLDCQFDKLMADKEIISLGAQVTRSYSDNSKAAFQAHMYVSGWEEGTELRKRFDGLMNGQYKNWKGFVCTDRDFVAASEMARVAMKEKNSGKLAGSFEKYAIAQQENGRGHEDHATNRDVSANGKLSANADSLELQRKAGNTLADQGEVIYLTSDSPDTLTELKPYHTYIIGGIVDKNRHKGICYTLAKDKDNQLKAENSLISVDETHIDDHVKVREIKTAKLPIGEYMNMTARHVLATNHVVEIMLKWLETGDWGEAFLSVMPKRKGGTLKEPEKSNGHAGSAASDRDEKSELNFDSDSEDGGVDVTDD